MTDSATMKPPEGSKGPRACRWADRLDHGGNHELRVDWRDGFTMMRAILQRGLLFALLWWIATEGRTDAWGAGLVAAAVATGASLVLLPPGRNTVSPGGLLRFLGFFAWQSTKGGMQVAVIALRPRLDLHPTVVELSHSLPPGLPRVLMAGALGLMPGTTGISLTGERLRLHVLDERLPVAAETAALEMHIARIFSAASERDSA